MKRSVQIILLILLIFVLALLGWLFTQKSSPLYQPIQAYQLVTPTAQVSSDEIDKVVKPYLGHSFWDIALNQIQADLTRLDWVRSSEVKRKWPDLLYISITEHVPVARWGESGLVNRSGNVFFPHEITGFENLVRLDGQLEDSQTVLRKFIALQQQFKALDLTIEAVSLSPDKVWNIHILNGPEIVLDSLDYQQKLKRFILAYPKLDSAMRKSARTYDLRYSNGFIVAKK
jgi:cell division protein FtsQ